MDGFPSFSETHAIVGVAMSHSSEITATAEYSFASLYTLSLSNISTR